MVGMDETKRLEIIDATSKHFKLDSDELQWLSTSSNKETVYTVLVSNHIQQVRSELGSNVYDQRGFEHLADQYAARQGAGKPLVTALAKMNRRHPSRYSTPLFLVMEALKISLLAMSPVILGPIVPLVLLLGYDPTNKIYDDPEARMKRIRHELISGMKDRTLSTERKKDLTKDLEVIDATLAEYQDRRSFYEYLYTTFLPGMRNQQKRMKQQQELEALANNELFAQSLKFSLMNA